MKEWIIKLLSLVIFTLLGGIFVPVITNLVILSGGVDSSSLPENFGAIMMHKTVFVWLACILIGFASLFIKSKWRYVLTLSPLYMPSLFVIMYSLSAG